MLANQPDLELGIRAHAQSSLVGLEWPRGLMRFGNQDPEVGDSRPFPSEIARPKGSAVPKNWRLTQFRPQFRCPVVAWDHRVC